MAGERTPDASVEPIPETPAATVTAGDRRLLVVADYHAGIEAVLRSEGVELDSAADERREFLLGLVSETGPDGLVVLGDLLHTIGDAWDAERAELAALFEALDVPVVLVKGNHDGDARETLASIDVSVATATGADPIPAEADVTVTPGHGVRVGDVGFAHGHTWPAPAVLAADVVCTAHEHPVVKLEDEVGGGRRERVWLRGDIEPGPFREFHGEVELGERLVVFPAFNDVSGGTWVNVAGQEFLSPFLPGGLRDGQAYLLDGTRLGRFETI